MIIMRKATQEVTELKHYQTEQSVLSSGAGDKKWEPSSMHQRSINCKIRHAVKINKLAFQASTAWLFLYLLGIWPASKSQQGLCCQQHRDNKRLKESWLPFQGARRANANQCSPQTDSSRKGPGCTKELPSSTVLLVLWTGLLIWMGCFVPCILGKSRQLRVSSLYAVLDNLESAEQPRFIFHTKFCIPTKMLEYKIVYTVWHQ